MGSFFRKTGRRHTGFTLIELLVVIAIIAILAAILFPVFTNARTSAYRSKCLSNCKQIATGLSFYKDDNASCWPSCYHQDRPGTPNYDASFRHAFWMDRISKYLKSGDVFKCPGTKVKYAGAVYMGPAIYTKFPAVNYGCNEYLIETIWAQNQGVTPWIKESALKFPSKTALIADCNAPVFWGQDISGTNGATAIGPDGATWPEGMLRMKYPETASGASYAGAKTRHGDNTSVVFADLHVKALPTNSITMDFKTKPVRQSPVIFPDALPM